MPKFTVQVEYLLPVYKHVVVEAKTIKEACDKAFNTDWDGSKQDHDMASREYISGIVRGEHEDIYQPDAKVCKVPPEWKFKPLKDLPR